MPDPDRLPQESGQPPRGGEPMPSEVAVPSEAADRSRSRSGQTDRQGNDRDSAAGAMRYASLGLELAAGALVFGGLGYWLDGYRQHERPYLGIVGVLLGFSLGMYRLILVAIRSSDES